VHEILKNYYLDKTVHKWKHNTYDQTVKYTKDIQKFLRIQYKKKEKRDKIKRKELLKKIIARKHKNNLNKLHLPFSIWHKKTILALANENANIIQNNFRAYIAKKHTQEILAKNKLKKLFKCNQLKNILNKIKAAGNKKILNSNRKSILNIIMKKKSYTDDKSALKRYFDKWRQYNRYTNNCVTKIANIFRAHVIDVTSSTVIFEATGDRGKITAMIKMLDEFGIKEVIRTGTVALDRGQGELKKYNLDN
jgi:acetolactate synthase small subunit